MQKQKKHILRNEEVELQGQVQIGSAPTVSSTQASAPKDSATQQVCIVENHPQYAIIEVTCSCGEKTYLKCEYATAESDTDSLKTAVEQVPA